MNGSNNCRIYSNPYIVSYRRSALSNASIFLTNCNSFMDIAILTNYYLIIYCDAIRMSNKKAFTYLYGIIYFYSMLFSNHE